MQRIVWKLTVFLFGVFLGYWLIDNFDPGEVSEQRVFITGASDGIGEQLAYQFARYGASVVVTARRENKLRQVVEKCRQLGRKENIYSHVVGDMIDLDSIDNIVQTAAQTLGCLDLTVLNHVFNLPLGAWTGSKQNLSAIKKAMTINFESYVHVASYALPHLVLSNGSLVVVSSFADTKNALNLLSSFGLNNLKDYLKPSSTTDAAFAILKAGTRRVREVTFPWLYQIVRMARDWIMGTIVNFLLIAYYL